MTNNITDVVDVTVSLVLAAAISRGFGVPLILSEHTAWADDYKIYNTAAQMLDDGFVTTDPAYLAAVVLTSQARRPRTFVIGRRETPVARVMTLTIDTNTPASTVAFGIDSSVVSVTMGATAGDTSTLIIAAANLVTATTGVTASAGAGTTVVLTGTAGDVFTITDTDAKISFVQTTAAVTAADDLARLDVAEVNWYGGMMTSRVAADQLTAAAWVQQSSVPHIWLNQTSDALSPASTYDTGDTDMGARMKALGYGVVAGLWHWSDAEYLDAMMLGSCLPKTPGTETWAIQRGVGVTASPVSALNATGRANLATRNMSYYSEIVTGLAVTQGGRMANGQWIDQVRLGHAIQADVSERVVNVFVQNDKVPMTDEGIGLLANQLRATFEMFEKRGAIDGSPKWIVEQPSELDISDVNRAERILDPPITGSCRSSGAIHKALINVTIAQ